MNSQQIGDRRVASYFDSAGRQCSACGNEIAEGELIDINEDAEYDGEGWRDRTTAKHVECPPDEA